jgi:excisionase family DNA binding protein
MHEESRSNRLVAIEELARLLRVPVAYLLREARSGRIPSLRAGNRRRFNPQAVEAALARRAAEGEQ